VIVCKPLQEIAQDSEKLLPLITAGRAIDWDLLRIRFWEFCFTPLAA